MRPDDGDKSKQVPKKMSSTFLVPGDLIEIPCNKKMPCDVILLNGNFQKLLTETNLIQEHAL